MKGEAFVGRAVAAFVACGGVVDLSDAAEVQKLSLVLEQDLQEDILTIDTQATPITCLTLTLP